MFRVCVSAVLLLQVVSHGLAAENDVTKQEARAALQRAVTFMQKAAAPAGGGYLWRYSADLTQREGERGAGETVCWVQPPGTPTVGEALLEAWQLSGEEICKQAAREAAQALILGQLESGGWDYRIDFDPKQRQRYAYRVDRNPAARFNVTTFDDDASQSALRFLMKLDQALEFQDAELHGAVEYALDSMLKAQYPNGGWPQRYSEFPRPEDYPVLKANYPETWSRTYPEDDYRDYYTFNDNALATIIDTLYLAADIYGDARHRKAAERSGDFILLAQLPNPQPAWAQQYNRDMQPAWARKFEPPSVTGGESQGILQILLKLYRRTGDRKFLEPIPRAVKYLRASELPDGRLARFYELKTNKPLYFTREYELTYSADDLPTHYGFIVSSKLDRIESEYAALQSTRADQLNPPARARTIRLSAALAAQARQVIDSLDERGAWVEKGELRTVETTSTRQVIDVRTYMRNLTVLARYLAARE